MLQVPPTWGVVVPKALERRAADLKFRRMLTLEPKTHAELYEEHSFLEFALPGETDLTDDNDVVTEREHLDDQIIAALVCP